MILNKTLQTPLLNLYMMIAVDSNEDYFGWMRDLVVNQFLESRYFVPTNKQALVCLIKCANIAPTTC